MSFRCPACGEEVQTRVLADPVTLVVVGECRDHGVLEVSRVYIGAPTPEAAVVEDSAAEVYPAEPNPPTRTAYKPGQCCGRRMGEYGWCHLPVDHEEPHAA